MKITSLAENTSTGGLRSVHGLSLYIETGSHRLLFDLGPDKTLFVNAEKMGIDLAAVDTVIISHGHYDHGGALGDFLKINHTAKVYVHQRAFEPHYSCLLSFKKSIGIDPALKDHPQVVLTDGEYRIDNELLLFTVSSSDKCRSTANDTLLDSSGRDSFAHEHNLIINDGACALVMGCGHNGVVNIMERAQPYAPQLCVGGFHLYSPSLGKTVAAELLDEIAAELKQYQNTRFYTCHCTGKEAFEHLSKLMPNLAYLSCGESIEL